MKEKWYEHKLEVVMENDKCKILCHLVWKDKNLGQIIDFACHYDGRMDTKELEKIEHYQGLAPQLTKIWNTKLKVVPLVIGAPGATPIKL